MTIRRSTDRAAHSPMPEPAPFELPPDEWDDEYDDTDYDRTCKTCAGDGQHPWDDCMPCPDCDGEGYEWWN